MTLAWRRGGCACMYAQGRCGMVNVSRAVVQVAGVHARGRSFQQESLLLAAVFSFESASLLSVFAPLCAGKLGTEGWRCAFCRVASLAKMHLSSFRRGKKKKRKQPKAWQVDLGLISKDEFAEQKKLRDEEQEKEDTTESAMKNKTTFATSSSATSKKTSWSKIKKEVRMQQKLEKEQEKIEVGPLTSLGLLLSTHTQT